jgi:hypothetical protein
LKAAVIALSAAAFAWGAPPGARIIVSPNGHFLQYQNGKLLPLLRPATTASRTLIALLGEEPKKNTTYQPTRPTPIPIGERRKPRPQGRPGFLRIDTVHQGDQDGVKGIYHINARR